MNYVIKISGTQPETLYNLFNWCHEKFLNRENWTHRPAGSFSSKNTWAIELIFEKEEDAILAKLTWL
jgi:hypothetical protein